MNYKKIIQSILIVLILTVTSLIFASELGNIYTEENRNININENNPIFTIKLKSNQTTGYSWFLREYDSSIIRPVEQTFEKPDQTLMGAPGYELWTFRVKPEAFVVPQQTTIHLIYARPWQMEAGTELVFQVTVHGNSKPSKKPSKDTE